ncbi:MAG: apolipoprotein N-acyltransferase [Actinomycetes bacterium]
MTATLAAPPAPERRVAATRSTRTPARLVLAVASGLALSGAYPPLAWGWLAPVAIALLVLALRGTSVRRSWALGLAAGLAFFLPLLHWSGTYVGALPWVALATVESLFVAALGCVAPLVLRLPAAPVWFAALWVLDEAVRARFPFGGFGWGRLAFSQVNLPTVHLAALGGAPLVSFAVALAGAAAAAAVAGPPRARWSGAVRAAASGPTSLLRAGAALLALGVMLVGLLVPLPTNGRTVTAAVVQGNVPQLGLDFNAQREAVLRYHVAATEQLAADVRAGRTPRPDVVIWPENSSDVDPTRNPAAAAALSEAARAVGQPILVGAVLDRGATLRNSALVWGPDGLLDRYDKRHPAPFAEYIPWRSFVRLFSADVDLVARDFSAGTGVHALQVGAARVAPVICFEVVDDALVRSAVESGGDVIAVMTNNATFGRSAESAQQLQMSRLRAVEHGRSVLSASTTGISAVIDPAGRVLKHSEIFTRDVLVASVPLRNQTSVADRVGAVPETVIAAGGLLGVLLGLAAAGVRRRSRRAGGESDTGNGSARTPTPPQQPLHSEDRA